MGGASCMLARAARGAFLGIVVAQPRWAGGGRTVGRAGGRAGGAGRAAVVAHCFGWPYVVWASYWLLPFFSSLFVAIVLVRAHSRVFVPGFSRQWKGWWATLPVRCLGWRWSPR